MSQQAIALWKSQLPSYDKIIKRCCYHIQNPMTQFLPPDFEEKIQQLRETLEIKEPQSYEPYLNVIVHFLEGKKNKSIIQLADIFVQEFGGSLKYWQNIILDVGEQVSYTPELSLWHVRKIFQQKLFVDAQNLSNYRRLCKLAKSYLSSLINLSKYITKFDIRKDSLAKIDDLFKKVKSTEEKYVGFTQQISHVQQSSTFDELSNNISQKSKQNALKKLFHFKEPARVYKNEKMQNTLFNYNFQVKNKGVNQRASQPTKNIRQTCKQLTGDKMQELQKVLKNIKTVCVDLIQLKTQFELKKENGDKINSNKINYTTIWDKDYYFSYIAYPIQINKFSSFTQPFQKHEWVNYEIQSDDEYHDLLGEDVDNNSEISSASSLTKTSFVVSDDHLSDDQNIDGINKETKPTIKNCFGQRWSFFRDSEPVNNRKLQCVMISIDSKLRFPVKTYQKSEVEQILSKVVDGKEKPAIIQVLSKQKIKISKMKLKEFLEKKCKTVVTDSNKIIYKVIELEDQNIQQNQKTNEYIPELDESEKEDLDDTGMYDPEYFSEPNDRMPTRRSKRQSEKLDNSKTGIVNGLRSRTSGNNSKGNKKSV